MLFTIIYIKLEAIYNKFYCCRRLLKIEMSGTIDPNIYVHLSFTRAISGYHKTCVIVIQISS